MFCDIKVEKSLVMARATHREVLVHIPIHLYQREFSLVKGKNIYGQTQYESHYLIGALHGLSFWCNTLEHKYWPSCRFKAANGQYITLLNLT